MSATHDAERQPSENPGIWHKKLPNARLPERRIRGRLIAHAGASIATIRCIGSTGRTGCLLRCPDLSADVIPVTVSLLQAVNPGTLTADATRVLLLPGAYLEMQKGSNCTERKIFYVRSDLLPSSYDCFISFSLNLFHFLRGPQAQRPPIYALFSFPFLKDPRPPLSVQNPLRSCLVESIHLYFNPFSTPLSINIRLQGLFGTGKGKSSHM